MISDINILQTDFEGENSCKVTAERYHSLVCRCGLGDILYIFSGGIAVFVGDNISSLQCAGKNLHISVFPCILL